MKRMKEQLRKVKRNERGLTLVELLAVIVILAIVAAIAFVAITKVIDNSRKDAHIANALQAVSAAKLAEASGTKVDPSNPFDVMESEMVDSMIDPWDKEQYDTAIVIKKNDGNGSKEKYFVTLTGSGSAQEKCEIKETPESELQQGRDTVCK